MEIKRENYSSNYDYWQAGFEKLDNEIKEINKEAKNARL